MKLSRLILILSILLYPVGIWAQGLKQFEQDLVRLYKKASPSVVSVLTRSFEPGFLFFDYQEREGAGSGVVIDQKGHILTNYHVVEGANQVLVTFDGDKRYRAKVIGHSPRHDLAVLQVDAPKEILVPATLGNSDQLQVGQIAIAIGNPFGMLGRTMTQGIVSAVDRDILVGGKKLYGMIQTDAPINPGNSGGALVNSDGEVVGISTLIFSQSGGSVGVGFAIPINLAMRFIPDLITKGHVEIPRLGAQFLPLNPELAHALRIKSPQGLLVLGVTPGGPAQKAGFRGGNQQVILGGYLIPIGGDVLISLNDQKIRTSQDLDDFLQLKVKKGEAIKAKVLRGGRTVNLSILLQGS